MQEFERNLDSKHVRPAGSLVCYYIFAIHQWQTSIGNQRTSSLLGAVACSPKVTFVFCSGDENLLWNLCHSCRSGPGRSGPAKNARSQVHKVQQQGKTIHLFDQSGQRPELLVVSLYHQGRSRKSSKSQETVEEILGKANH